MRRTLNGIIDFDAREHSGRVFFDPATGQVRAVDQELSRRQLRGFFQQARWRRRLALFRHLAGTPG